MTRSPQGPPEARRERLPTRRVAHVQQLRVGDHSVHVTVGCYEDGAPAEVFVDLRKLGAPLRMFANALAVIISIGLQHGVPAAAFRHALEGTTGGPGGDVEGDEEFTEATSIPDLLVRLVDRVARAARERR